MGSKTLEHTLVELERRGGRAWVSSSTSVGLAISLSGSRPNGSVISALVYRSGPTLADGTPLRTGPGGRVLRDLDDKSMPEPSGYDALEEAGVRDELVRRDWIVDGAGLRKNWFVQTGADRRSLREEIEGVLAAIGANDDRKFTYRAPGEDGGFGQVGCAVTLASAAVASVIGVVVLFIVEGHFNPGAGVLGFIAGWLTGTFVLAQSVGLVVLVSRLRPKAESAAILAGICTSGVLALVVTMIVGLGSA